MDENEPGGRGLKAERGELVWSVDGTARRLGISRAHTYEPIARHELPSLRLGRRIVVPRHAIESMLGLSASTVSEDHSTELVGGFSLQGRSHMAVEVEGDRDVAVPKALAHDLRVDPG
jgi:excisionase family DNA binding protein